MLPATLHRGQAELRPATFVFKWDRPLSGKEGRRAAERVRVLVCGNLNMAYLVSFCLVKLSLSHTHTLSLSLLCVCLCACAKKTETKFVRESVSARARGGTDSSADSDWDTPFDTPRLGNPRECISKVLNGSIINNQTSHKAARTPPYPHQHPEMQR